MSSHPIPRPPDVAAIVAHRGSLRHTYEALGLSRKTLHDKMRKHGPSRRDYTGEPDG